TRIGDSDGVTWWENTDEELIPHNLNGFMYLPRSVVAADFDDDNLIDIAATWHGSSGGSGGVYWWRNTGNGTFPQSVIHDGESPYDLHLADFDLDGDQDLLSPLSGRGEVVLFRNLLGVSALIQGAVTSDAEDLPLSDILVTIRETGNSDLTDSAGSYVMNAAPGFYTVDFEHACWEDLRFEAVEAIEDSITILNVELHRSILSVSHSSLNIQAYNAVETIAPLLVSNRGDADLTIHADVMDSGIQDGWLSISPIDTVLPPGEETVFSVSIAPDTSNLAAWDYYGEIELYSNSCPDTVLEIPVFVHVLDTRNEHPAIPMRTMLHLVYPNPFNSSTRICYDLAVPGRVDLKLFDIQGRQAASLFSAFAEAGTHNLEFNGSDFASGIYFLRLTSGHENYIQKLHLLK
ncbi:T9SS type A sorting domain-containing protein, partial [bacterium]|nr:T9SS type A sorting domain-containing protein [bacterium]